MKNLLLNSGNYFDKFFNASNVRKIELLILRVAVFAFLFHLIVIFLGNNFIYFKNLQHSYLKAIYTPFNLTKSEIVYLVKSIIDSEAMLKIDYDLMTDKKINSAIDALANRIKTK